MANVRHSPVDGGYGWAVVFGSFLTHFLLLGLTRSFGILYVALLRIYGESAAKTATLSACFNTARMLLAPLVSVLCKRTSCRISMITGGVIMMIGLVSSAFAPSLNFLYFSYGIVGGTGSALLFTPPYIIIGQYFDKRKGLAMSLGTVGAGLGSAVMAPTIVALFSYYGYTGCMIILGGFALHHCITGALFRPFTEKREAPLSMQVTEKTENGTSSSAIALTDKTGISSADNVSINDVDVVVHSKDNCAGHDDKMIPAKTNEKQMSEDKHSSDSSCCDPCCKPITSFLNGAKKSLSLFTDVTMILYGLVIFALPIGMGMVIFFIADAAVLIGASDAQAAFIMTCFGFCDVIGRLGSGIVFDLKPFRHRRRMLFAILGMLVGLVVAATGLLDSYAAYLASACSFGLVAGGFHAQRITVISEFVAKERLPDVVGVTIFCQGLGNLIGSPLAGFVRDTFGNYDLAYYIGGIWLFTASALFLIDFFVKNKKTICKRESRQMEGNTAQ